MSTSTAIGRTRIIAAMFGCRRLFARFATVALLGVLLALAGCHWPRAQLVVTVETDFDVGPGASLESIQVVVRSGDESGAERYRHAFLLGPGATSVPFSFGVYAINDDPDRIAWIEARGCGADACAGGPVVSTRVRAGFVRGETRALTLRLSESCAFVPCESGQTCESESGTCVPESVNARVLPHPGETLDAGTNDGIASSLSGAGSATCATLANGQVRCWGGARDLWTYEQFDRLGPDERARWSPAAVPIEHVAHLAVGIHHACAIDDRGRVLCWGWNGFGQLGSGDDAGSTTPREVPEAAGALEIVVTGARSCARMPDGGVICWGVAFAAGTRSPPTRVEGLEHVIHLAGGRDHVCARLADRSVRCLGANGDGQLGNSSREASATPVAPELPSDGAVVAEVYAGGDESCVRRSDGSAWCWGANAFGQCGNGSTDTTTRPTRVSGLEHVVDIAVGRFQTCVRLRDASVWCTGRNDHGQIGLDGGSQFLVPTRVTSLHDVTQLAIGAEHACARSRSGEVTCFGSDAGGQLASGRTPARASPVDVGMHADRVRTGPHSTCMIDGTRARCWGLTVAGGAVVASDVIDQDAPRTSSATPAAIPGLPDSIRSLALGFRHTCALDSDGAVYCWGMNNAGQLGDGTTVDRVRPVRVESLPAVASIAAGAEHTCVTLVDGGARCWGRGGPRLGFVPAETCGGAPCATRPGTVSALPPIAEIAARDRNTCAVARDGSVLCWGENGAGQLAQTPSGPQTTPARIRGLPGRAQHVVVGQGHACALLQDRTVWCWGTAIYAETGTADVSDCGGFRCNVAPQPVYGAEGAVQISAGQSHTCITRDDGSSACWGFDLSGLLGGGAGLEHLWMGRSASYEPIGTAGLAGVAEIAAGSAATCARTRTGRVYCFGENEFGQLGDGTFIDHFDAAPIPNFEAVDRLFVAFQHACAIRANGSVVCWGDNFGGQLANGSPENPRTPTRVAGLDHVTQLALGEAHTCARRDDGTVWCWGSNRTSQLTGVPGVQPVPARIASLVDVQSIAAGIRHTCALDASGNVVCWGWNERGALGDGTITDRRLPTSTGIHDGAALFAGRERTCVAHNDGTLSCWGGIDFDEAGSGSPSRRTMPSLMMNLAGPVIGGVGGPYFTCALLESGDVQCFGANYFGNLGDGTATPHIQPGPAVVGLHGVQALSAWGWSVCALDGNGSPSCWGNNGSFELGEQSGGSHRIPTPVAGWSHADEIATGDGFTCARRGANDVSCWGRNDVATLGNGTVDAAIAPGVRVPIDDVAHLALAGRHACAIHGADGSVSCWGSNHLGQLGTGDVQSRATPGTVIGLADIADLELGFGFGCARVGDGTVHCFGGNSLGQLGNGTTLDAVPASVVHDAAGVAEIAVGSNFACGRDGAGTVECWGDNTAAEQADPDGQVRLAPGVLARVGAVSTVRAGGSHACAITADRHVRCWGDDRSGQLGASVATTCPLDCDLAMCLAQTAGACSADPVTVPSVDDAIDLALGGNHSCALRADGTVWCWGANSRGQLGDGTMETRSEPRAVPALSNVIAISAGRDEQCESQLRGVVQCRPSGEDHTCAITTDGSLYCWGRNDRGQLGDGTFGDRSIPVRVSIDPVQSVACGGTHTCAITRDGALHCWGDNAYGELGDGARAWQREPRAIPLP